MSGTFKRLRIKTAKAFVAVVLGSLSIVLPAAEYPTISTTVQRSYFGLHIHKLDVPHSSGNKSGWPPIRFGSWRLWGSYVSWMDLEPSKGNWQFQRLDKYVALAQTNGVELLYTLGFTPRWASARPNELCAFGNNAYGCSAEPRDLLDWENYIRTVARRYKGRIKQYEIWNEPAFSEIEKSIQSNGLAKFFSGSAARLVEMGRIAYKVIKEEDPEALVISPSAVTGELGVRRLETYLAAGGVGTFDVVGFHFYTTPPEKIVLIHKKLSEMLSKYGLARIPIWNTEMGYVFERPKLGIAPAQTIKSIEDVLPAAVGAGYVARTLIVSAALGIGRVYWFDWETERPPLLPMGLADNDGRYLNDAGTAYAQVVRWLANSSLEACAVTNEVWLCPIRRDNRSAWILWSTAGAKEVGVSNSWGGKAIERLDGSAIKLLDGGDIQVGPNPILVKLEMWAWSSSQGGK